MRINTLALLLVCLGFALPLMAQSTDPTPSSEPFSVLPNRVNKGAKGTPLLFSATTKDLFASNSVKQPTVTFGAGVTLVEGSFAISNSAEARATVDVDDDAIGGVLVRISFYSADGTSIVRQEQATIGVIGKSVIADSTTSISAERLKVVAVNVAEAQQLGAVILEGQLRGNFTFTPPAGMLFESGETPVVTINGGGSVSNLRVDDARGELTFSVVNLASATVTLRIDNLQVDTQTFGDLGGTIGNQSSTVTGTSLGEAEGIVVNAHTALQTLEGDDLIQDEDEEVADTTDDTTDDGTTTDDSTDNVANNSSSSNNNSSSSSNNSRSNNNRSESARRNNESNNRRNRPSATNRPSLPNATPTGRPSFKPTGRPNGGVRRGGGRSTNGRFKSPTPRGFTGKRGGAGASSDSASPMHMEFGRSATVTKDDPATSLSLKPSGGFMKSVVRSQRLYFADKNYNRQDALLLAGKNIVRTWIVLERASDVSEQIDHVQVQIRHGGQVVWVTLTETGPKTSVFRSSKKGIEISASAAE